MPGLAQVWKVVSNHWTGLWTGSLYWTDGLDYWTYLWTKIVCTTWPPPNQMCWIGSHVWCLAANICRLPRILERKDATCSNYGSFVPKRPWKALKGMRILQQRKQLGRPICSIIYSKASRWPGIVFTWLHSTRLWVLHSLVTTNQYSIWHQHSPWHSGSTLFFGEEAFVNTFDALLRLLIVRQCFELTACIPWIHDAHPCNLCIVHSCTFTTMQ